VVGRIYTENFKSMGFNPMEMENHQENFNQVTNCWIPITARLPGLQNRGTQCNKARLDQGRPVTRLLQTLQNEMLVIQMERFQWGRREVD
jgi:hypothetical protein